MNFNPILESYINDFCKLNDFNEFSNEKNSEIKATIFEHFANHCIFTMLQIPHFDLFDIHTGGGSDAGIDGFAVIVNDHIILDEDELEYFIKQTKYVDVKIVFIQTKLSNSFKGNEMLSFFNGIENVVSMSSFISSDLIKEKVRIIKSLYKMPKHFKRNPQCLIYYVTTGKWLEDEYLTKNVINPFKHRLYERNIFSDIDIIIIDQKKIQEYYFDINKRIEKVVNIDRFIVLPKISKVNQAYIGILPCIDYIQLLQNENGELMRNLFTENVRDFLGDNRVNHEVIDSINDESQKDRFVILNNGVTLVAEEIRTTGNDFTICNFQIVNGCQTSHILYNNKDKLTPTMFLPLKIIETQDNDVMITITKATNRQTAVQDEAFESLKPFQKEIEEYYRIMIDKYKIRPEIYYARRTKQYYSMHKGRSGVKPKLYTLQISRI